MPVAGGCSVGVFNAFASLDPNRGVGSNDDDEPMRRYRIGGNVVYMPDYAVTHGPLIAISPAVGETIWNNSAGESA